MEYYMYMNLYYDLKYITTSLTHELLETGIEAKPVGTLSIIVYCLIFIIPNETLIEIMHQYITFILIIYICRTIMNIFG